MKKCLIIIVIAAAILFAAGGCSMGGILNGGQKEAGISYIDPQIDMAIYVGGGDWEYEKDDEAGQVYFYIPGDIGRNSVISISSVEIKEDIQSQLDYIWGFFVQQIADMDGTETGWLDITAGKYAGKELDFTMTEDNVAIDGKYLVWNTDQRIYMCSVTALDGEKEQVDAAVGSILQGFKTTADVKEENRT